MLYVAFFAAHLKALEAINLTRRPGSRPGSAHTPSSWVSNVEQQVAGGVSSGAVANIGESSTAGVDDPAQDEGSVPGVAQESPHLPSMSQVALFCVRLCRTVCCAADAVIVLEGHALCALSDADLGVCLC